MNVASFLFIIFVACALCIFYVIPSKLQWGWILFLNICFYLASGVPQMIFIIATSLISWAGCNILTKMYYEENSFFQENKAKLSRAERKEIKINNEMKRKRILIVLIFVILGQLIVLKYNAFFLSKIHFIYHFDYGEISFLIPLGISFYTMFVIGYCIDVYRGQYDAERNLLKHTAVVSYFPCITQGPIERYQHLADQIFSVHILDGKNLVYGVELALWGLFKKLVIADHIVGATSTVFNSQVGKFSGAYIVFAAFLYAIQLYADFSGYTDIVRGVSQMFGIDLLENFDTPYFSKNVAEFWRRWHISLGTWYKDYLFYPILRSAWCQKLNRFLGKYFSKSTANHMSTSVGLLLNWALIGAWHGAAWKYIMHGLYYGLIMIFSMWMKPVYERMLAALRINSQSIFYQCFQMLRTFVIVSFGYILFCARSARDFLGLIKEVLFSFNIASLCNRDIFSFGISEIYALLLFFSVLIAFIVEILHLKGWELRKKISEQNIVIRWAFLYGIIFAILIFGAYGAEYSTSGFLYQFF